MKKSLWMLLLLTLLIFPENARADAKDGEYRVKVSMLNAYEDTKSMGGNALDANATLYVHNGNARLRITFVPLNNMDFKGFLGDLQVNGNQAKVLSSYPDIDAYNHPETGSDAKMKGRLYPKTLEFPIDLNSDTFPCSVYVPVMQEMGLGVQNARLRVTYPEDLHTKESEEKKDAALENPAQEAETEAESVAEAIDAKGEHFYKLPVSLRHAQEDKLSMGNEAMGQEAILHTKDGKMTLYLASKQMKVGTITTSLSDLYYDDGKEFIRAKPHSFRMKLEGKDELRPEVFSLKLRNEAEFLKVMVDPKVEAMGDAPIKAGLKIDFSKKKEVKEENAFLYRIAKTGKGKPNYDPNADHTRTDKGVRIDVKAGSFDSDYEFSVRQIRGEELSSYSEQFDALESIKVYELSALAALEKIPYDEKRPIRELKKHYQPKNAVQIYIPVEEGAEHIRLYRFGKEVRELDCQKTEGEVSFSTEKLGVFALLYEKVSPENSKEAAAEAISDEEEDSDFSLGSGEEEKYENMKVIVIFILVIMIILIVSGYFFTKYLKILRRELYYAEQLKNRLNRKSEKDSEED